LAGAASCRYRVGQLENLVVSVVFRGTLSVKLFMRAARSGVGECDILARRITLDAPVPAILLNVRGRNDSVST
jgi:hypothetical protein